MQGKTVVVTGATDGIGLVTARDLVKAGARVVIPARNLEKAAACREQIGAASVEIVPCDTGDLGSVRAAAADILARCPRIDVLVNNAGGAQRKRALSPDGFERTLAINHLGPYLLTRLLLPRLLEAPAPRVVFTSSRGHHISPLDFADLQMERGWNTMKAYGRTKLMNVLTARELHRRYAARGLAASSLHPGGVRTGIWAKAGPAGALIGLVGGLFMISSEAGADTLTWLAASDDPDAAAPAGRYFVRRKPRRTARFATDEAALRLWVESARLVGLPDGD